MQEDKILLHNVMHIPWPLPDESVHCCVTSPPYWGLRDYGMPGQLGLEKTPEEFIQNMVAVFSEVYRVLKPEGTLWVNIGDTYYGGKGTNGSSAAGHANSFGSNKGRIITNPGEIRPNDRKIQGLKPKDLVGIPWMLAFALRAAGWYLRQDIIWNKPNPMPETVHDRCTKAHEYIFLLSKSHSYYYDAYSIATDYKDKTLSTYGSAVKGYGDGSGLIFSENLANRMSERRPKKWKTPDGWDTGKGTHGSIHKNGREKGEISGVIESDGKANKRSVWTVGLTPFKEAHFATFPEKLILPCILAGCPKGGIVLDPFMGAGTTALVARSNDRKFIGLELNPEYIKLAEKRLKQKFGMFYTP